MKIEALVELVRTIGESVQQLSALVEGMPKAVDAKLASMREMLLSEAAAVRAEVRALRGEFGDVQADGGALRALFDTTTAGLREATEQIIADNRAQFTTELEAVRSTVQSLDQRINNVGGAVDDLRRQTENGFEEARTRHALSIEAVNKSIEEQHTFTSNVRTACDTTDLHHAVATLKSQVATGEEGHQQLADRLGELTVRVAGTETFGQDLAKQISDNETIVLTWRKEDTARISELETKVSTEHSAVQQSLKELAATEAEHFALVRSTMDGIADQAQADRTGIADWHGKYVERLAGLETKIDTVDGTHRQSWAQLVAKTSESLADVRTTLSQLAVENATGKDMLTVYRADFDREIARVAEGVTTVAQHAAEIRTGLDETRSALTEVVTNQTGMAQAMGEAAAKIQTLESRIATVNEGTATAVLEIEERFGRVEATAVQLGESVEAWNTRLDLTGAAVNEIKAKVYELQTAAEKDLDAVGQRIAGIEVKLATGSEVFADLHRQIGEVSTEVDLLSKTIEPTVAEGVAKLGEELRGADTAIRASIAALKFVEPGQIDLLAGDIAHRIGTVQAKLAERIDGIGHDLSQLEARYTALPSSQEILAQVPPAVSPEQLQASLDTVQEQVRDTAVSMTASLDAHRIATSSALKDFGARIDGLPTRDEVLSAVGKAMTRSEVDAAVGIVRDEINARHADLSVTVDTVVHNVASMHGDLAGVSAHVQQLEKAIPPPFDPTPIRMELMAWIGERLAEAKPELPEMGFDVAMGDDHTVMFTFNVGDKEVTRTVPLGVGIEYRGVYSKDEDYFAGNIVTHDGSMWIAKAKPTGAPGKDITGWQLAVKCGRDGKDAVPTRAYSGHETGRTYRETDFLRINNRLWQCCVKRTTTVPEPGDIHSTAEWTLIGGIQ